MTNNDDAVFAKSAYMTDGGSFYPGQDGLTKREYFAAMAMSGLMAGCTLSQNSRGYFGYNDNIVASTAVEMADKLIAELNKEPDNSDI